MADSIAPMGLIVSLKAAWNLCLLCDMPAASSICAQCTSDSLWQIDTEIHGDVLSYAWAHPHLSHLKCDQLFALDKYRYPLTYLIPLIKFHERPDLARYLAQQFYAHRYAQVSTRPDALISVPLHRKRKRARGYNQAALLANELQRLTGIVHFDDVVTRSKFTHKQSELNKAARQHNIAGAFAVNSSRLARIKRIAIIDDVVTTGATMNEMCQAIFAVAPHVYIDVWCMGVGGQ